jgi:hypothetical protein
VWIEETGTPSNSLVSSSFQPWTYWQVATSHAQANLSDTSLFLSSVCFWSVIPI